MLSSLAGPQSALLLQGAAYSTGATAHLIKAAAVALSATDSLHAAVLQGCQPLFAVDGAAHTDSVTTATYPPELFAGDWPTPPPANAQDPASSPTKGPQRSSTANGPSHAELQASARQQLQATLPTPAAIATDLGGSPLADADAVGADSSDGCWWQGDLGLLLRASRRVVGRHLLEPSVACAVEELQALQALEAEQGQPRAAAASLPSGPNGPELSPFATPPRFDDADVDALMSASSLGSPRASFEPPVVAGRRAPSSSFAPQSSFQVPLPKRSSSSK